MTQGHMKKIKAAIKTAMAATIFTAVTISIASLGGCSKLEPNPLSTVPASTATHFLESADKVAVRKIRVNWGHTGYQDCMDGKHKAIDCNRLYSVMLDYAKTQRLFASLTKAQLTDQSVWKKLKDAYEEVAFDDMDA